MSRPAREISLPLMGIGNIVGANGKAIRQAGSLLLMGIGNYAERLHRHSHGRPLITPHGDRKLVKEYVV